VAIGDGQIIFTDNLEQSILRGDGGLIFPLSVGGLMPTAHFEIWQVVLPHGAKAVIYDPSSLARCC
jgi:hypothetical protein